ncbi:NAD-dependent epimerase/dehydratase family protein [Catellatospora coxensis]
MRILVVGGTGLIGAHVVEVLGERGHAVTTVARSGDVDHVLDAGSAQVEDLRPLLAGHDGVVYAARTDEQRPLRKPIHPAFRRDMVDPVVRLFMAARAEGLTRGVVMGSYYTYFDRLHPQWRLTERHTYIRSRVEQAREGGRPPGRPCRSRCWSCRSSSAGPVTACRTGPVRSTAGPGRARRWPRRSAGPPRPRRATWPRSRPTRWNRPAARTSRSPTRTSPGTT